MSRFAERVRETMSERRRRRGYDVLGQAEHWDERTREVVLARAGEPPPVRFFDAREERTLRAFCDVATGQEGEPRIPVLEMVDAKLYEGNLDGFRYEDMPADPQTWRLLARKLDEESASLGGGDGGFAALEGVAQRTIVGRLARGELQWPEIPSEKAWSVAMRAVLSAFYSHPLAWNEIGFGGPAYPRGYARLGAGQREHWEPPPSTGAEPVPDSGQGPR